METIKRYGMKMGDLRADAAFTHSSVVGRAVPKKYMETPSRLWMKRMIRVMGLFSFVMTAATIATFFLGWMFPGIGNEAVGSVMMGMIMVLLFVNHLGLFLEMAGDRAGRNWFAMGAGLMWLSLFGTFLIAIVVRIVSSLF